MHATSFTAWTPMAGPAPLRPLAATLAALDVAVSWILCAAMGVMVAVVGAQVALRYGFNSSIDWADEIARLCFVWSIFLAIALGVKTGSHIGIEMVVAKFPRPLREALARLVALVCAAALALVAWESLTVARDQWDELMGAVNASTGWFLVPLVIGGVHGALHFAWIALNGPPRPGAAAAAE
jgi:TRAP-type C4-dicarboxylate transport system permease small subunit